MNIFILECIRKLNFIQLHTSKKRIKNFSSLVIAVWATTVSGSPCGATLPA